MTKFFNRRQATYWVSLHERGVERSLIAPSRVLANSTGRKPMEGSIGLPEEMGGPFGLRSARLVGQ